MNIKETLWIQTKANFQNKIFFCHHLSVQVSWLCKFPSLLLLLIIHLEIRQRCSRNCQDEQWLQSGYCTRNSLSAEKKDIHIQILATETHWKFLLGNFHYLSFKFYEYFGDFDYFCEFKKVFVGRVESEKSGLFSL